MAHDNHIIDGQNKDLSDYSLADYLRMTENWTDPLGELIVEPLERFNVVREDKHAGGTKARFGDFLMSTTEQDTIAYVAPRVGHAGIALQGLAEKYNKRLVLFAPACKEASKHQRKMIEMGAELRWLRIAAMPNLNRKAKAWAEQNNAAFFPLGLHHPKVIAAGARVAYEYAKMHGEPEEVWAAISTGVMSRALQIGWPNAKFNVVAVARNLKAGEAGRSQVYSHPLPFVQNEKGEHLPDLPIVPSYDGKVWRFMREHGSDGAFFWNTADEPSEPSITPDMVDSQRGWGDDRDLQLG